MFSKEGVIGRSSYSRAATDETECDQGGTDGQICSGLGDRSSDDVVEHHVGSNGHSGSHAIQLDRDCVDVGKDAVQAASCRGEIRERQVVRKQRSVGMPGRFSTPRA